MVPFRMHDSGWLLLALCMLFSVALCGLSRGMVLGYLVAASLVLHELGHIAACFVLRVPVREFGLCLGGAYNRRAYAGRRRDEAIISAAGPLMNLCLVLFPYPIFHPSKFHGVSLLASPILTGLAMSLMGTLLRRKGKQAMRIESFGYGFTFALGMAVMRFFFVAY